MSASKDNWVIKLNICFPFFLGLSSLQVGRELKISAGVAGQNFPKFLIAPP